MVALSGMVLIILRLMYGLAVKIVVVGDKHHPVTGNPLFEHIGTGTHRLSDKR